MIRFLGIILIQVFAVFLIAQPASSEESKSSRLTDQDATVILQRAVEAIAPLEKFDSLESLSYRGESVGLETDSEEKAEEDESSSTEMLMVFQGDIPKDLLLHSIFVRPSGERFVRTLSGERSFAGAIGDLPPDLHRDLVRYASTKLVTLLRFRNSPGVMTKLAGSAVVEGKTVDLVEIQLFDFSSVLEVERETGQVLAIRFPSSEIQEGVGDSEVRRAYSDFRTIHGWTLPFLQETTVGGEPYTKWQLDEIVVNGDYDKTIFDPSH
ncbi:MAG: hypothetical protein K0U98_25005 [Deltaproteobacteria bacterium]|nr:hypothetical protein [Deltaproteobacteria bacterium]